MSVPLKRKLLAIAVFCLAAASWGCTKKKETNGAEPPTARKPGAQQEEDRPDEGKETGEGGEKPAEDRPAPVASVDASAKQTLVSGQNELALELYKKLGQVGSSSQKNLFFSPISISTALAMTYAGAAGKTSSEMHKALHFGLDRPNVHAAFQALMKENNPTKKSAGSELVLANKIFVQKGFAILSDFKETLERFYGASAENVEFKKSRQAAAKINGWVKKQTREKIEKLVEPTAFDSLTKLVLANAIYFKGKWRSEFKEEATKPRPFFLTPKTKAKVDTMYQEGELRYGATPSHQLLELSYEGDELSMVILLPKKKGGLASLEKKVNASRLESWLKTMRKRKVKVYIPKLELEWGRSVKAELMALGIKTPFSDKADFSRINGESGDKGLYISDVIHKAFVEVNEEGTEAAGATGVVMKVKGAPMPPKAVPVFRADHPFMFLIRNKKSGLILFMGRAADPRPK
jgi:serpin B